MLFIQSTEKAFNKKRKVEVSEDSDIEFTHIPQPSSDLEDAPLLKVEKVKYFYDIYYIN